MNKLLITDPNKCGVCFVFSGDYLLAKVMPIENDHFHLWSEEAPTGSLVCEYATGGATIHSNMEEVIQAIQTHVNKMISELQNQKEAVSDHAHNGIHELQLIPC